MVIKGETLLELIKQIAKKPRVAGTKQNDKVRNILIKKLESLDYQIRIQKMSFTGWKLIKKPKLKVNGKQINVLSVVWTGSGKVKGKLVKISNIKTFEVYEWHRWKILDKNKTQGYIISREDMVWMQLIDKKSKKPYFMVDTDICKKLNKGGSFYVEGSVKSKFIKNLSIKNIITKNNEKNKIIICCHYDSFYGAPGANDNASGVASVLELAKRHKNNKRLQFIMFDAEEWNKYGSYSYVRSLKKNQLRNINVLINIDSTGSKIGKLYIIASKKFNGLIKTAFKKLKEKVKISNQLRPPFDFWPFAKKGVGIIHFGSSPYNHFHKPSDTYNKLSEKNIKKVVKIVDIIIEILC